MDQLLVSKLFRHPSNIHSIAKFVRVKFDQEDLPIQITERQRQESRGRLQRSKFEIPMLKIQYLSRTTFKGFKPAFVVYNSDSYPVQACQLTSFKCWMSYPPAHKQFAPHHHECPKEGQTP